MHLAEFFRVIKVIYIFSNLLVLKNFEKLEIYFVKKWYRKRKNDRFYKEIIFFLVLKR